MSEKSVEELDAAHAMIKAAHASNTAADLTGNAALAIAHLLHYFALEHKEAMDELNEEIQKRKKARTAAQERIRLSVSEMLGRFDGGF